MAQDSQNPAPNQRPTTASIVRKISNALLIFFAIQFLATKFMPKSTPPTVKYVASDTHTTQAQERPETISPMWPTGSLDLRIYISPHLHFNDFREENVVWKIEELHLGDWHDIREKSFNLSLSKSVQNNGTLFAHTLISRAGISPDPRNETYRQDMTLHVVKCTISDEDTLNNSIKSIHAVEEIFKSTQFAFEQRRQRTNKGIHLDLETYSNSRLKEEKLVLADQSVISYANIAPVIAQHIHLHPTNSRDETGKIGFYYPIVYHHEFWKLKDSFYPINSTLSNVPLHIRIQPLSFMKFQIFSTFDEGFKRQEAQGAPGMAEVQEMKRVILETNIWLLSATIIVSILHSLFEFLAFKNGRTKKDNTGISIRTILSNVIMQTIILLYLIDQNEQTSWIILGGQGFGILLEAWKITKTVDIKLESVRGMIPWRIRFVDKHILSETEAKTEEYDEIAFKYLYWVAAPLLVTYAAYSFLYDEHKGYYSFVITTLVGFVYTWGFLMMVPSLYINYRLKSVAHMPGRTMIYKFFNTFIDDMFAFVIKMPTLHRIATLRDDVIFFIYIYQCYLYPVDKTRPNEFGQTDEVDETKGISPGLRDDGRKDGVVKIEGKKHK
ncbi:Cleft lip and palate transmembrane protein 1 [Neolecta irregularis DAH-3]|uniref:Cleft lip and palate transmembrane protein 1 n=1 Tax=Neolecta irregularis (strain DAH-3) TaxID=1198029 RepID=A0A1U7LKA1_NEOID|nr:Cleft lip and palate transmembrane protein 1 [Neolecta irregularis DAH-3]|eukprot:OLL23074.1 Cleft lip and palate transmembrane protein 1 [Neolecta irregularis DAH-3]